MLEKLPLEVLRLVLKEISRKEDLKALCEVSKYIHQATVPLLYENVTISLNEGLMSAAQLGGLQIDNRKFAAHIKVLSFETSFCSRMKVGKWCPLHNCADVNCRHMSSRLNPLSLFSTPHLHSSTRELMFDEVLLPFLQCLKDNSLQGFSWNLGACIPRSILGPSGYINTHHGGLASLSLITDGSCLHKALSHKSQLRTAHNLSGLAAFDKLRLFSWRGMYSRVEVRALKDCLKLNHFTLEDLTLEFHGVSAYVEAKHFLRFARDVMLLAEGNSSTRFPSLTRFSLANLSFRYMSREIFYAFAFNMSALRSLKLWNCASIKTLLRHIVESEIPIRLTTFELVNLSYDYDQNCIGFLINFLGSFNGLESLFLMISKESHMTPIDWDSLGHSISIHAATLSHLVLHERFRDPYRRPWYGRFTTNSPSDDQSAWAPGIEALMSEPHLDCVGISIEPEFLARDLRSLSLRPTYRLLHLKSKYDTRPEPVSSASSSDDSDSSASSSGDPSEPSECDDVEDAAPAEADVPFYIEAELHFANVPIDIMEFAQWAFGPDGLPNLQILAYGDFSNFGRHAEDTVLLCRVITAQQPVPSTFAFRYLTKWDHALQDLVREKREMLEACATEGLMMSG
ncbi:hypothetical protein MMC13_005387 [Lambiella insularis]|nr:hypothetical protein [Lambiella insularis]